MGIFMNAEVRLGGTILKALGSRFNMSYFGC